jgi:hypothetical protein
MKLDPRERPVVEGVSRSPVDYPENFYFILFYFLFILLFHSYLFIF